MKIYKVTAEGIEEIRQFMQEHHLRPDEATTDSALAKWVMDAEIYADLYDMAVVTIPAEDSKQGKAISIELEGASLDVTELSEELG
ncbi:MAG: hypothetical protein H6R01_1559 [Burkholderiaceae bacterium]|nr:hypothetical protein [Burkholderiaceae bacterium]